MSDKWLVDENGAEYRLEALAKSPGHQRISETELRTVWGITVRLDGEDESNFYFRSYRTIEAPPVAPSPDKDPKKIAEALATYNTSLSKSDEWTAIEFDKGLPRSGQWREGFEFADIDLDGELDLVHGPPRKTPNTTPVVFKGDGQGAWHRMRDLVFPDAPYDYGDVTVGDLNRDGLPDLAFGVHQKGLLAVLNLGQGRFGLASDGLPFKWQTGGELGFSSRQVQAVDWDGDGRLELLAIGEGPRMVGQGNTAFDHGAHGAMLYRSRDVGGSLQWEAVESPRDDYFGEDLTIADVDGDGRRDFVAGSGTMEDAALFFKGDGGSFRRVALPLLRPKSWVRSIAAGEFNGDGRIDLAVTYQTWDTGLRRHGIDLLLQLPDGEWERKALWSQEGRSRGPLRVAGGDITGDGLADIVAIGDRGQVWIFLQRAHSKGSAWAQEFSPELTVEDGCAGYQIRLADLDGDRRAEIAASFAGEPSALFAPTDCPSGGALRVWRLVSKQGK